MIKRIFGLFLLISVLYGLSTLSARAGITPEIPDGNCAFALIKETPQVVESQLFDFIQTVNGVDTEITVASNPGGPPDLLFVSQGTIVTYTEVPQEGWTLYDIQCFDFTGVDFTTTDTSATLECVNPSEFSLGFCVFFNRVSADKIPTLSEWGMIAAAAGLGLVGLFFAVRRRREQAGL
jgi:MYXO-CTERM domain-containing protein